MGLEKWRVLPADKIGTEHRYVLQYEDIATARTQPFLHMSEPMTEAELRLELKKLDAQEPEIDAAIDEARRKIDELPPE